DNLYDQKILQLWQLERLDELLRHLAKINRLFSGDAVKYIRQKAGYDGYIWEYAKYRGMKTDGLFEILDELQEAAKAFGTPGEFAAHMDEAVAEAKAKKQDKNAGHAPGVVLTTMHSAKGLEFETVFVAGAVEGYIPYEKSKTEAEIEEERRLFYVGLTRSRMNLYISLIGSRYEKKVSPSRFLDGLELETRKTMIK
ncbi:MAG: ATP-binding domain-containing protein, partial [Defluviitaleaceae bacterium]|nr:ATP-binding domain-containing protein [Defluviitaleaceae bacterium]